MAGGDVVVRSLRCRLGVHVHDLDAAVDRVGAVGGVLQLGLAVADGDEIGAGEAVVLHQIFLDGVGSPLGEPLIVPFGADRIALLKYGVDDLQLFFQGDVRFLEQFV